MRHSLATLLLLLALTPGHAADDLTVLKPTADGTTPEQALQDARLPQPVRDFYAAFLRATDDASTALDAAASDAVQAQLTLDQAHGLSTWFTRYATAQSTTLDPADVDFGRPQPVSAARQHARAFFSDRPELASSYRALRRVVRRTLGLGP